MPNIIEETQETTTTNTMPNKTTTRVTTRESGDENVVAGRTHDTTLERIIYYIMGLISTVLAIRFVLSLLGANTANSFANFIYSVSYPLVAPFFGLFGYKVQYGVARFEIETLVAIAVYAAVGYGIVQLIRIIRKTD